MEQFRTDVLAKYIDLIGFPMDWADEECGMFYDDAHLQFSINIESREYGIRDINVHTKMIEIFIGDRYLCITPWSPITIDGELVDGHASWDIVDGVDLENKQIIPDRIELDWENRKAYVYYG